MYTNRSKKGKPIGIKGRIVADRSWVDGRIGLTVNEYRISFWRDKNVLKLDIGDKCNLVSLLKTIELCIS